MIGVLFREGWWLLFDRGWLENFRYWLVDVVRRLYFDKGDVTGGDEAEEDAGGVKSEYCPVEVSRERSSSESALALVLRGCFKGGGVEGSDTE